MAVGVRGWSFPAARWRLRRVRSDGGAIDAFDGSVERARRRQVRYARSAVVRAWIHC